MEYDLRTLIKNTLGILFFIGILALGYFGFRKYYQGPKITSISIAEYTTTDMGSIDIFGQLTNVDNMSLNGRSVIMTEKRTFHEKVALMPGINIVELDMRDIFGKTREYRYTIYSTLSESEFPRTYLEALDLQESVPDITDENLSELPEENIAELSLTDN